MFTFEEYFTGETFGPLFDTEEDAEIFRAGVLNGELAPNEGGVAYPYNWDSVTDIFSRAFVVPTNNSSR